MRIRRGSGEPIPSLPMDMPTSSTVGRPIQFGVNKEF